MPDSKGRVALGSAISGLPESGGPFGGTNDKNYSIWGVYIWVPLFMEIVKPLILRCKETWLTVTLSQLHVPHQADVGVSGLGFWRLAQN